MVKKKISPKIKKEKEVSKPLLKERYFEAVGRRKTAIARVRLYNRKGGVLVNEKDYLKYFPINRLQQMVFSPLEKTKLDGKVNVIVRVSGGGLSSQAEAIRHGLARALILFDLNLKPTLKSFGYLKRDPRMVERKKFGLKKARRAPQWAKR
jgi:small subunit ribosomal protein S9